MADTISLEPYRLCEKFLSEFGLVFEESLGSLIYKKHFQRTGFVDNVEDTSTTKFYVPYRNYLLAQMNYLGSVEGVDLNDPFDRSTIFNALYLKGETITYSRTMYNWTFNAEDCDEEATLGVHASIRQARFLERQSSLVLPLMMRAPPLFQEESVMGMACLLQLQTSDFNIPYMTVASFPVLVVYSVNRRLVLVFRSPDFQVTYDSVMTI